jgi:serine/threonine protein kinase
MQNVSHPNLTKLIETFIEDGILHLVLEFANDGDLSKKIKEKQE